MSTFENVKETLTNKLDELKNEVRKDSEEESYNDTQQEQDLQAVPDNNTEIVDETPGDNLIAEEPAEDRLATDYDLVQNDVVDQDEIYDSGFDDLRDEEIPDETINGDEGSFVVDSNVVEVSEYGSDGELVSEERVESGTIQPLDPEEERRLEEVDDLYNSPELNEAP